MHSQLNKSYLYLSRDIEISEPCLFSNCRVENKESNKKITHKFTIYFENITLVKSLARFFDLLWLDSYVNICVMSSLKLHTPGAARFDLL